MIQCIKNSLAFTCLLLFTVGYARADTNDWLDATMLKLDAMDFEFARGESDIPFIPALSLGFKAYGESEFHRVEGDAEQSAAFRTRTASGYAMLPLHIAQRGMAMAIPYIAYTRFHFTEGDIDDESVTAVYLPLAAIWQTERGGQWGAFVMPASYSPLTGNGEWAWSGMGGLLGRHFSGDKLVWYYGAVYDYSFSDGYFLPYVGFTYIVDPSWIISMVAPWPAISYAPSDKFFLRAGFSPSGASWALEQDGADQEAVTSFGGWDLGLWANWRISRAVWFAVGGGVSGLRSFEINTSGDTDFEQDVSSEPWVSVSFSVRPQ
jgi:hypothetical protein